jgi:asparagine N-glycosylation enzyme membrane subunit Stt3
MRGIVGNDSMRFKAPSSTTLIWLIAGIIAALSCSLYSTAAYLHGEYLPVGGDSFYHARRILDTVRDLTAFYEFDPKIHAPEGSLLVWPWGYDYLMALIVRGGLALGLSSDPMAIMVWIPVAAVFVSIGLLIAVARGISLSTWPTALAALCMALAPTTQFLHGTGQIDHHYAELIMILASLAAGLKWFREPDNSRAASVLAIVCGIAPAIHNGMFVLQLPLLLTLFIRWLQGVYPPRKPVTVFAAVLLLSTSAILLPSTAFRTGQFDFFLLSWFHLYVAFGTALVTFFFSRAPRTPKTLAVLAVSAVVLIVPIFAQIELAQSFVSGRLKWLESIAEMKSPLAAMFTPLGVRVVANMYSFLFYIAPLTWLLCVLQCWRERGSNRLLFWIACVLGLSLLFSQVRMHYFGDFALYLPWLALADGFVRTRPHLYRRVFLAASLLFVLLYAPVLRYQLVSPVSFANDEAFSVTRPMFATLHDACAKDPGIVLADNNAGHYVRYYTDCSVIANNFLLTPLHFQKMDEAERDFQMSARELLTAAPGVKYVLVRPLDIKRADDPKEGYKYWFFFPGVPRLAADLLLGRPQNLPHEYQLLEEIRFPDIENIPFARLYKIERGVPPAQTSANDGSK